VPSKLKSCERYVRKASHDDLYLQPAEKKQNY
jgi:hypothetical protein